ncbi:uncharacterized protein EI97DRAFT_429509 [Westerdykella ornata]|uniref:BZIP domain-containing protein n=1 Tax=Westerdykella ornata TaxID=318751 RepID=A0A6A6K275_WESOR|nr:uncharacterized protein EI97DRAFT_429509 [Westerdykella ornata]KAF2281489.1 hypothetical protein EI97DRAFT_429509 [Westerdykella ornata]
MASEQLVYQNFTQAMTTPAMISVNQLTPPPSFDPTATTIKMEDLTIPLNLSTPPPPSLPPTSHPTPSSTEAKPVKKRKSWGQVLPEPKTNLPPRKRAKTEDEKEQRRIERVKRNRLAAHNSRERKRQEVEQLQAEKDKLEVELKQAKATMALMAAQIQAFQARHPDEALEYVFDASSSYTSSSSPEFIRGSSETVCPRQTSLPSPPSTDSATSPRDDSCQPETPAYTESVATDLDQTRYPAVSVELGDRLPSPVSPNDPGFPFSLQLNYNNIGVEEKPIDDLFNFDQFPDQSDDSTTTSTSHSSLDASDFFTTSFFDAGATNPYGLSDSYDAKTFDLQTTSGAANASDGVLAAGI